MDGIDIAARLIGAFYALGGVLGLHATARDAILDKALASITLSAPDPDDVFRRRILTGASTLTALSGVALLLLAGLAPWLFLLNLAAQAGWLVYARKRFPPQDEAEAAGRRSVARAALLWAVATAVVVWLDFDDRLGPLADPAPPLILAAAAVGMLLWVRRHLAWNPSVPPGFDAADEPQPVVHPARVRLALRYGYQTLWDADDGRALNPYDHLPSDLAKRLLTWEDDFHLAVDPHEPDAGPCFSAEEEERHAAEGEAIAEALREVFGRDAVDGPFLQQSYGGGELSAG